MQIAPVFGKIIINLVKYGEFLVIFVKKRANIRHKKLKTVEISSF